MITYIYVLNKFSDDQVRINLDNLSRNFELDNNCIFAEVASLVIS